MFVRQYAVEYLLTDDLVSVFMITNNIAACRSAEGWDWALVSVSIGTDVLMVGHSIVSGLCTLLIDSSMVIR